MYWSRAASWIVISLLAAAPALAQANPQNEASGGQAASRRAEPRSVRVYTLSHTSARELASVVGRTVPVQVSTDDRSNALVVAGSDEEQRLVEAIITQLDRPAPAEGPKCVVEYIPLSFAPDTELLRAAQAAGSERMRVAAVGRLLQVVGTERDVVAVNELVARAAQVNRACGGSGLRLSFFFLQMSLGGDAGDAKADDLPPGLAGVVKALAENGFRNPQLIAPLMVHAGTWGEQFDVSGACSPSREVRVSGRVQPGESAGHIVLQVSAELEDRLPGPMTQSGSMGERVTNPFKLQTMLTAKLGDYVVLAASPDRSAGGSSAIVLVVHATSVSQ